MTADVQVACDPAGVPAADIVQGWVEAAVAGSGRVDHASVEVSVRIVDSDEMQTLNRLYRKQDRSTNVLSFPAGRIDGLPDDEARSLGDLVVCAGVVASEAAEQGKRPDDHWGHMLVHGTLHLLGFDHETDADAAEMEALETRILAGQGVADPYESQR